MNNITKIAHRCGVITYPEQTLASAAELLSLGADWVEIDIRFGKNNSIIISHDDNIARLFGKDLKVADISGTFFVNSHRTDNPAFRGYIFDDFLKDRVMPLLLHVKEGGEERIKLIAEGLNRYLGQPKTAFGVESLADVEWVRKYAPGKDVLAFMNTVEEVDSYLKADVDYIRLWEAWTTKELVDKIHNAGKKVWIMVGEADGRECGIADKAKLDEIISLGVDGVLINDIRELM